MQNDFTPELIEKAKQAKSAEELITLAKENKIELSAEEAKEYFERLNKSGELSDDELDNVSGGGCGSNDEWLNNGYNCRKEGCHGTYEWDADERFYICNLCGDKI